MTTRPLTLRLRPFDPLYASLVASWVDGPAELQMLAPATDAPLTAAKLRMWHKCGVHPFLGWLADADEPVGYGEVNAMPYTDAQMWLGHILVCPEYRGLGVGRLLVQGLLEVAFGEHMASGVCMIVFPDNAAAIRCYAAAGMEAVGPERWRHPETGEISLLVRMEIGRKKYRALLDRQRPMSE